MPSPRYFATPGDFRDWLAQHAADANELVVGFHKVDSGKPSMTWPESVDEALCYGWIDGVRTRIDEARYKIRFTPRKPDSIWSAVNIAKAEALIASGRMQAAGAAAFARRSEKKSKVYAYEQDDDADLAGDETARFRKEKAAWEYFGSCPPGYRRVVLHWITTAKRSDTRARRLEQLIEACRSGKRL